MKNSQLFSMIGGIALIALAGCQTHTCPPPEVSMECYPICREVREKNAADAKYIKKQWEIFKNTRHHPYVPLPGYDKFNEIGKLVSKVTYQVTNEIVIPYLELDREGLICGYIEFSKEVQYVMESKKCDSQEAMSLVWADWQRQPGGMEKCLKLAQAVPRLEKLKANEQIRTAVRRGIAWDILNLTLKILEDPTFKKERRMLQRDLNRLKRRDPAARKRLEDAHKTVKSADRILRRTGQAAGFLKIYLDDKHSQQKAIEKFILDMNRMSKESDQHNSL